LPMALAEASVRLVVEAALAPVELTVLEVRAAFSSLDISLTT